MGSCLDRFRNENEEGCGQIQSSSADQNQVTENTCSSGSEDPGENIEDDNTKKSSSDKESQNTGEINSGESQDPDDIVDTEEKGAIGNVNGESSSAKQNQHTDRNFEDDNTKKSSSDKESQDTGEINSGEPQDADEREEKEVDGVVNEESSSAKQSQHTEIDLIVLSPLPEGVKRFYKALERNIGPNVRIREVSVNDFMEEKTGNNLVIVICNITTRALSDVTATLDKIKDDMRQRIFLICLHWKNPAEAAVSAAKNIVKRNFPSIKETVDMAYYRIKDIEGLHTCELNTKALETIEKHIHAGDFTTK